MYKSTIIYKSRNEYLYHYIFVLPVNSKKDRNNFCRIKVNLYIENKCSDEYSCKHVVEYNVTSVDENKNKVYIYKTFYNYIYYNNSYRSFCLLYKFVNVVKYKVKSVCYSKFTNLLILQTKKKNFFLIFNTFIC